MAERVTTEIIPSSHCFTVLIIPLFGSTACDGNLVSGACSRFPVASDGRWLPRSKGLVEESTTMVVRWPETSPAGSSDARKFSQTRSSLPPPFFFPSLGRCLVGGRLWSVQTMHWSEGLDRRHPRPFACKPQSLCANDCLPDDGGVSAVLSQIQQVDDGSYGW